MPHQRAAVSAVLARMIFTATDWLLLGALAGAAVFGWSQQAAAESVDSAV